MWELDCEEGWTLKNWCFWTVVLEKILENPLDCKEIQPVHSEGDEPWDFFGRNDAKAETPVLWPTYVKSWLIGKESDAGRDWGQEEKGMTEDEMAGWHHWLDGHESEWTLGVGDGQGDLACCDSWGGKEPDTTERLNWTELNWLIDIIRSSPELQSCGITLKLFSFTDCLVSRKNLASLMRHSFLWGRSYIFLLLASPLGIILYQTHSNAFIYPGI